MIIYRDYKRSEEDDWKLNVQDKMDKDLEECIEIRNESGIIIAWKIQKRYE